MKGYSERKWLNKLGSGSTGSITVFDDYYSWEEGSLKRKSWVEFKDCHSSVRLHKSYNDSNKDFISKVKKMRDVLDRFLNHLVENQDER